MGKGKLYYHLSALALVSAGLEASAQDGDALLWDAWKEKREFNFRGKLKGGGRLEWRRRKKGGGVTMATFFIFSLSKLRIRCSFYTCGRKEGLNFDFSFHSVWEEKVRTVIKEKNISGFLPFPTKKEERSLKWMKGFFFAQRKKGSGTTFWAPNKGEEKEQRTFLCEK